MKISRINKFTQSKSWLVGLVLASLVGGFLSYRFLRPQEQHQDLSALTVPVKTRDLRVRVSASGTIVSLENVNLSPKTAGRLTQLFVDQGDRVQKGQILAKMDDRDVRAQLQKAKADLAQAQAHLAELQVGSLPQQINDAQAQVNTAQARLTLSQRRRQRNQELAKLGAISQDQLAPFIAEARTDRVALEKAQRNLELVSKGTRPASIAQAQAQVAQAQAQLQAIQVQLEDTLIRAPFSGTVTQKYATVGAFVTPTTSASATSSATSTSIVALNSGTEALANVPEVDVGQIRPGQLVEIVADAYPGQTFWGRVHLIAPEAVVQQNVTSFQVRATLKTGQALLRSGMNVDLTFLGEQLKHTLVVPTVAIVNMNEKVGVFVLNAQRQPQFRSVTTGPSIGEQTQILGGLKLGEQVFISLPKVPKKS